MTMNVPCRSVRVVTLDDLADTRRILSLLRHVKTAVVVGGGVLRLSCEGLVSAG